MRFIDLQLETAVPEACRVFYEQLLGLPSAPCEGAGFAVQAGHTTLRFTPGVAASYHFAFNIPENQVLSARDWLGERVELVRHEGNDVIDFPHWNAHSLYFWDPAGNIVELIARHNLPNARPGAFDATGFLSVSEVGAPVPDVGELLDELAQTWHEPLWSGNRERFAAAGDEEGLLIAVNPGRHWFPTELTSGIYPLSVVVAAQAKGHLAKLPAGYRFEAV